MQAILQRFESLIARQLRDENGVKVGLERAPKAGLENGTRIQSTCMLVRCDEAGFGRAIEVKVECARPT